MAKRGRPKDPNSQRSLLEKKNEAERMALEAQAETERLAAELAEKEQKFAEMEATLLATQERAAQEQAEKQEQQQQRLDEIEAKLKATILEDDEENENDPNIYEVQDEESMNLKDLLNEIATTERNAAPELITNIVKNDMDGDFGDDFEDAEIEPEIIQKSEQKGKVKAVIPPKEMADILVNGFDSILQWAAPFSYQKMAFSSDEMRRFREIQQMGKMNKKKEVVLEDSDYDLFARMDEFLDYKKTIPLTEAEKQSLKIPLEVMLQEKGGDIPPGWALVYAATAIALPRFAPHTVFLITKQFSRFNNQNEKEPNSSKVHTEPSDNGDQTAN